MPSRETTSTGQRGRYLEMRAAVEPVTEREMIAAHSPELAAIVAERATESGVRVGVTMVEIMSEVNWR